MQGRSTSSGSKTLHAARGARAPAAPHPGGTRRRAFAGAGAAAFVAAAVLCGGMLGPGTARAQAASEPTVVNRREIALDLVARLLAEGLVPDGTLHLPVRIREDGRVEPQDAWGILNRNVFVSNAVRDATAAMRVRTTSAWLAAHPDRRWSVHWMFQDDGCEARAYDAPSQSLPVRVCLRTKKDRADTDSTRVLFDLADRPAFADGLKPKVRGARWLPYPSRAREDRVSGMVVARASVGRDGRTSAVAIVSEQPPLYRFRDNVEAFLRGTEWNVPPRAPGGDPYVAKLIAFEFLIAPCISVPEAAELDTVVVCTHPSP